MPLLSLSYRLDIPMYQKLFVQIKIYIVAPFIEKLLN